MSYSRVLEAAKTKQDTKDIEIMQVKDSNLVIDATEDLHAQKNIQDTHVIEAIWGTDDTQALGLISHRILPML